ncbi:MAG: cellulase family glycosylhydrolase [Spirochaetales bacterium]|nr:cellulase family glycosylhydrolase [Spirochaetales bacterium]
MYTQEKWFKDDSGRTLMLRGVNLSGSTKVPATPDGATHKKESLLHPGEVSFVNKPFPLDQADEHFSRLKSWGLTFLRFLVTWEAVEHKGPGMYDEDYLTYLESIMTKAADYGINVFIDPHNDMWSRWTGGDGAPGWTMDLLGMKLNRFHATGASVVHAYYRGTLPRMIWTTNQFKLGAATMFTLFFGGNDFAPHTTIEGEPVQEYLQGHYIDAMKQVALRLKNHKNVVGYETLNEPFEGFVGHKHLDKVKRTFLRIGENPTPFQSMISASGYQVEVPFYEMNGFVPKIRKHVLLNPEKETLWKDGYECIWKQNGVWTDSSGTPCLLHPHYFYIRQGRKTDFEKDYLKPFMLRYLKAMRSVKPDTIIFLGSVPGTNRVDWSGQDGDNVVNADHWYDVKTLFFKKFTPWFTINTGNFFPSLGKKNVEKAFASQLGDIKSVSAVKMGNIPTLIGEVGLPFDMNERKAYISGDFSLHTYAMNLYMNALDSQLLNFTIWNYTPDNTNEHGDLWNEEDLSVFSLSQQDHKADINSGARALPGFCRPYARKVAGEPLFMRFHLPTRRFTFSFRPDPDITAPTEIFVPPFQYPHGFDVKVEEGTWEKDPEHFTVLVYASVPRIECKVVIKPVLIR